MLTICAPLAVGVAVIVGVVVYAVFDPKVRRAWLLRRPVRPSLSRVQRCDLILGTPEDEELERATCGMMRSARRDCATCPYRPIMRLGQPS